MGMTDSPLLQELLAKARNMQLCTLKQDGSPHLVTMWFGLLDEKIVTWTQRRSQKAANLRRDPRLACLIEAGDSYTELRGASINGSAELITERTRLIEIGHAIMERNFAPDNRPDAAELANGDNRVGVIIHVTDIATWDFRSSGTDRPKP